MSEFTWASVTPSFLSCFVLIPSLNNYNEDVPILCHVSSSCSAVTPRITIVFQMVYLSHVYQHTPAGLRWGGSDMQFNNIGKCKWLRMRWNYLQFDSMCTNVLLSVICRVSLKSNKMICLRGCSIFRFVFFFCALMNKNTFCFTQYRNISI